MAEQRQPPRAHPDARIAAIAASQHGVVSRGQLEAIGLRRGAIDHRIAAGRLHRLHLGVYAVGHHRVTVRGRWMAAVLRCSEGALLSHRSAAALWGLVRTSGSPPDVTVAGNGRTSPPRIALHRTRKLDPEDRALHDGIPVTSVPRTLVDLAWALDAQQLRRAFEEADRLRILELPAVRRCCERHSGRPRLRELRALVAATVEPAPTRSELERRFLYLCRDAGLPAPSVNVMAAGHEVDALWPRQLLVVELDGYEFHRSRAAFERDRARDGALQLAGYRVLRITSRRLETEPTLVTRTIRSLLDGGGTFRR